MPPVLLSDSPRLVAVPPIDPHRRKVLSDHGEYTNWGAVFADDANVAVLDFLLTTGDYRSWGSLDLSHIPGHTRKRPRTIRYFDGGHEDKLHPVKRPKDAAQIGAFIFRGDGAENWLLHGLTISTPVVNCAIREGAHDITVDFCLIEDAFQYSIRIIDAFDCTVQRCVIRETRNLKANGNRIDSSGVQIGARLRAVAGINVLDNEIYNVGDGVQLTQSAFARNSPIEACVEGNDLYLEPSRYIDATNTTFDENAIDLKAGSDAPESTVIRGNRMWGIRRNANPKKRSAAGELLVVHQYCRNVLVEDNIMGDAPRAISDRRWPANPWFGAADPRHIVVRNNQFYEIRDYAESDAGAIARPVTSGIVFTGNYFARSTFLADTTPPSGYEGTKPLYTGNTLIDVRCIQRSGATQQCMDPDTFQYDPTLNSRSRIAVRGYEMYQRKRWTGPELTQGAKPAQITPDTVGPISGD